MQTKQPSNHEIHPFYHHELHVLLMGMCQFGALSRRGTDSPGFLRPCTYRESGRMNSIFLRLSLFLTRELSLPTFFSLTCISIKQPDGDTNCAGSLIHPEFVATSIACAGKFTVGSDVIIASGSGNEETIEIAAVYQHPDYDPGLPAKSDVMAVQLAVPSANLPININRDDGLPVVGQTLTWNGYDGGAFTTVELTVVSAASCQSDLANGDILDDETQFCATGDGKKCTADSGT